MVPKVTTARFYDGVAVRIKAARMSAGFPSARQFAKRLDIQDQAYRKYERGESAPSLEILARIATATNYTLDWIIAGYGSPLRTPPAEPD